MTAPRLITAEDLGLEFRDVFGPLGPALSITGHFTAGPRAGDWRQAVEVARRLHVDHLGMGWGGCGYHFMIADDGTPLCLRPASLQGAHVGGHNSGNVGVCCAGGVGHRPTRSQRETYAWLLANAHTTAMPGGHRTADDLRAAGLHVHSMWHSHSTNPCAGPLREMYLNGIHQPSHREGADHEHALRVTTAGYPPPTEFRGIVADGCHVSVLEAHRAAVVRDRDARAGAERDADVRPRRAGRLAYAAQPVV